MPEADDARCKGVTSVRGIPLPCCVRCERRIIPAGQKVKLKSYQPEQINREWVCEGRIAYPE